MIEGRGTKMEIVESSELKLMLESDLDKCHSLLIINLNTLFDRVRHKLTAEDYEPPEK